MSAGAVVLTRGRLNMTLDQVEMRKFNIGQIVRLDAEPPRGDLSRALAAADPAQRPTVLAVVVPSTSHHGLTLRLDREHDNAVPLLQEMERQGFEVGDFLRIEAVPS